jgi:outer membrane protein OmpA-like peptidoglycan-associated protein
MQTATALKEKREKGRARQVVTILALCLLAGYPAAASETVGAPLTPPIMESVGGILVLNGSGMRTVFTSEVYAAGLYLPAPEKHWREVVEKKLPMAIRIRLVDAFLGTGERIRNSLEKGLLNHQEAPLESGFQKKLDAFLRPFSENLKNEDVFIISYMPDEGVRLLKNGEERALVSGYEFKKAVFSIWLGEDPEDRELKEALLRAEVPEEALALQAEESARPAEKNGFLRGVEEKKEAPASEEAPAGPDTPPRNEEAAQRHEKRGSEEKIRACSRGGHRADDLKKKLEGRDIYFPQGGKRLTEEARRKLSDKVKWLKANPGARIVIEGHSDASGPAHVNYRLAEERSRQVKAHMARAGIDPARMAVKSYGEEHPAVPGDTSEARARNRRVHIRLLE